MTMTMLLTQPRTKGLKPDHALQLGGVPDSVMALIRETLDLNGRLNVTLSSPEIQLLKVAQRELQIYGVSVSYEVDQAEMEELASGIPPSQADKILSRRSRVVTVQIKPTPLDQSPRSTPTP